VECLRPVIALLLAISAVGTSNSQNAGRDKTTKKSDAKRSQPAKPFDLPEPPAQEKTWKGADLTKISANMLQAMARKAAAEDNYADARRYQYWSCKALHDNYYDLACYYFQTRDVEGGLYWLQFAALSDGVDANWADRDADLASMRSDKRWRTVRKFLGEANKYWATSGITKTVVLTPKNHKPGAPIPVVVWLHGMGASPNDMAEWGAEFPDALDVAMIGVSGTNPRGKTSFVWSDDRAANRKRIEAALAEAADRVKPAPGKIVLMGFSQGACAAAELAQSDPKAFAGAIVMSPGGLSPASFKSDPEFSKTQGYVAVVGAREMLGNVFLTRLYGESFKRLGARLELKEYPGVSAHSFPEDFEERFPHWVKFVLEKR
jgi:predicted esterase